MSTPSFFRSFMRTRSIAFGLVALGCLVLLAQCGGDKTTKPDPGASINENILALSHLEQVAPFPERPAGEADSATYELEGRTYECSEQEYEVAAGFDEQLTLNPTSDILWPGALIDGATILTGEYVPIVAARAPLTISISLVNIAGEKSRTVADPKLSTMRNAIGEILAQEVTGATDARVTYEIQDVRSEQQLDIALGVTYNSGLNSVKNQFDFSNTNILSRTLVKFLQVYYTIDVDVPQRPSDLFASSVVWQDLSSQISGSTSPMYVASIAYGRMALFSMESTYSSTQVKNTLEASMEAINTGGTLDTEYQTVLDESTMKATIIGGSGADAVGVVNGFEGLKDYMTQGGNYNRDTAAAPMAYKLRYLSDNGTCQVVMAQSYTIRTCEELKEGHYGLTNDALYHAQFTIDYILDGAPKHDLYDLPSGDRKSVDLPAKATHVIVVASSFWLGDLVPIFRYPISGSSPHPEVICWRLKGILGSNPSFETVDCVF